MSLFIRIMEQLTGRPVEKQKMRVLCNPEDNPDEIEALALMTMRALHEEIKFGPPGKKLNIITTADFDNQGKIMATARKRIEELAKAAK